MDIPERLAIESARHQLRIMEAQRLIDRLQESARASSSRQSQLINWKTYERPSAVHKSAPIC